MSESGLPFQCVISAIANGKCKFAFTGDCSMSVFYPSGDTVGQTDVFGTDSSVNFATIIPSFSTVSLYPITISGSMGDGLATDSCFKLHDISNYGCLKFDGSFTFDDYYRKISGGWTATDQLDLDNRTDLKSFFGGINYDISIDYSNWNMSTITSLENMFYYNSSFTGRNIGSLDVSHVDNMGGLFRECESFTGVGLEHWRTPSLQNMSYTFYRTAISNVDLSSWDVSSVSTMAGTFGDCKSFTGVGLEHWRTPSLENMQATFYNTAISNVDLSSWDVSSVSTMGGAFYNCIGFNGVGLEDWRTLSLENMSDTFYRTNITNVDLSSWDVSSVSTMYNAFYSCTGFTGVGLEHWRTPSLQNIGYTFQNTAISNVDLSSWDVSSVSTMEGAFYSCTGFTGVGLEDWRTPSLQDMSGTFYRTAISNVDLSSWDVSSVSTMYNAFYSCTGFTGVGLEYWRTPSLQNMIYTFTNTAISDVDLSSWDVSSVDMMNYTFQNCTGFTGVGLEHWRTPSLQNIGYTFQNTAISNVDLSSWDVSSVSTMYGTFVNCTGFTGVGLEHWRTPSLQNMGSTFEETAISDVDFSSWDVTNVEYMGYTFYNCTGFTGVGLEHWDTRNVDNFTWFNNGVDSLNYLTYGSNRGQSWYIKNHVNIFDTPIHKLIPVPGGTHRQLVIDTVPERRNYIISSINRWTA